MSGITPISGQVSFPGARLQIAGSAHPTEAGTRVAAVDPHDLTDDPRFATLTEEAARRLRAVIAALGD